ncbi:MAG: anthranilate synthase component I [Planctomycetes bacterium]|nr:anthranilate synthase component I [Planctomycetota bacterium]
MESRLDLVPYTEEIPADLETPVSAYLKLQPLGARFLLESVERGEAVGRYSFLGASCRDSFVVHRDRARWRVRGENGEKELGGEDPLRTLSSILARFRLRPAPGLPPLAGGAVGHVSYDYVRYLERIPRRLPDPLDLPLASFYLVDELVVFDHVRRKILLVALAPEGDPSGRERLAEIRSRLAGPTPRPGAVARPLAGPFESSTSRESFEASVRKAQEHIRAGDIFQVVLSRRLSAPARVSPFAVYRSLRIENPSPYMFFLDFDDYQLVGSSPEALVTLSTDLAVTRPIAGTRPRGATPEEDARLAAELLADPKERAEHLMLVDLARNDLGRVCRYGSIQVAPYYAVERYSHVMHIVSGVSGRLAEGHDAFDLFRATFPAGTVSGAPKVRAMELIEDLETIARGPYAGAVGYFGLSGEMDTAIAIRTVLFEGGRAHLQAGAGIVHDSDPAREFEETANKMRALEVAIEKTVELA